MAKYIKKPIEIEAVRNVDGVFDEMPDWLKEAIDDNTVDKYNNYGTYGVITLEGIMICPPGSYLIRGAMGELYPCRGDIFKRTYDQVKEDEENV